jgi:hypothetical protein
MPVTKKSTEKKRKLNLSQFKTLIKAMPTEYSGATVSDEISDWADILQRRDRAGRALRSIFDKKDSVELCRGDLKKLAKEKNLDRFVMATLLWGYPSGMRNTYAADIADNLPTLVTLLGTARRGIKNWSEHFEQLKRIRGISLSTYSKLLYFLSVKVDGYAALILDARIRKVGKDEVFEEFSGRFTELQYPAYLKQMHSIAKMLDVLPESLEFFLFLFGRNLKQPPYQ